MGYADTIVIEECPKILPLDIRPSIVELQRMTLIESNSKDYSAEDIETLIRACNEGFIFRRKNVNVIAKVRETNEVIGIASASYSGIILAVFVHPHYQRRGIGKSLVVKLEEVLSGRNVEYIWLTSSTTAQAFFETIGYKNLLKARSSRNLAVWVMRKKLSNDFLFRLFRKELMIFVYCLFITVMASGKSRLS